jgi:hypothetical protein
MKAEHSIKARIAVLPKIPFGDYLTKEPRGEGGPILFNQSDS